MKQLLEERSSIKKQERTYAKEFNELKEELGSSLPSDDKETSMS